MIILAANIPELYSNTLEVLILIVATAQNTQIKHKIQPKSILKNTPTKTQNSLGWNPVQTPPKLGSRSCASICTRSPSPFAALVYRACFTNTSTAIDSKTWRWCSRDKAYFAVDYQTSGAPQTNYRYTCLQVTLRMHAGDQGTRKPSFPRPQGNQSSPVSGSHVSLLS